MEYVLLLIGAGLAFFALTRIPTEITFWRQANQRARILRLAKYFGFIAAFAFAFGTAFLQMSPDSDNFKLQTSSDEGLPSVPEDRTAMSNDQVKEDDPFEHSEHQVDSLRAYSDAHVGIGETESRSINTIRKSKPPKGTISNRLRPDREKSAAFERDPDLDNAKEQSKPVGSSRDERHANILARMAYLIRDTMTVGVDCTAIITITKSQVEQTLFHGLMASDVRKLKVIPKVNLSPAVTVILKDTKQSGDTPPRNLNFIITPRHTSDTQLVDEESNTVWKWNVRPITAGEHQLEILVSSHFSDGNHDIVEPALTRTIKVRANYGFWLADFFADNWQWGYSVLFSPLLIWLGRRIHLSIKNRQRQKPRGVPVPKIGFDLGKKEANR